MHVLVELYTPKAAWLSRTPEERVGYVAGVREAVAALETVGVTCLALGQVDQNVDSAAPHSYFGVWSARDEDGLRQFLDGLRASGWYDYFDHVNGAGRNDGLAHHLAELEALDA